MDGFRFDALVRSLTARLSRRMAMRGLFAVAGLDPARAATIVSARKRGTRPQRRNAFGCVPVGRPCRGKDGVCCSGMCDGRRPRKGGKDRSRCVGHDGGSCASGQRDAFCGGTTVNCTTSSGFTLGTCNTTTGDAGYCAQFLFCEPCRKDADCQPAYGPRSACALCGTGCPTGTACTFP